MSRFKLLATFFVSIFSMHSDATAVCLDKNGDVIPCDNTYSYFVCEGNCGQRGEDPRNCRSRWGPCPSQCCHYGCFYYGSFGCDSSAPANCCRQVSLPIYEAVCGYWIWPGPDGNEQSGCKCNLVYVGNAMHWQCI